MKKLTICSFLTVLLTAVPVLEAAVSSAAEVLATSPYARANALSDAMVADDSAFALFHNPAGIAGISRPSVGAAWDTLLGQDISQLAGVYNMPLGKSLVLGAAFQYDSAGAIPLTEYQNSTVADTGDTFSASDIALRIGAAMMFPKNLRIGAAFKFLSSTIGKSPGLAYCGDAGVQIQDILPNLYVGLAVRNLGIGPTFGDKPSSLPMMIDAGLQYAALSPDKKKTHLVALYLQPSYLVSESAIRIGVGVEYGFLRTAFFRAGASLDEKSLYKFTLGVGLRYKVKKIIPKLDISFIPEPVLGHKLNISFNVNL
jgi:hypothetical protein